MSLQYNVMHEIFKQISFETLHSTRDASSASEQLMLIKVKPTDSIIPFKLFTVR